MMREFISGAEGLTGFGVIGLLLFVTVFSGAVLMVWRMNKSHAEAMGRLPLEDETPLSLEGDLNHDG